MAAPQGVALPGSAFRAGGRLPRPFRRRQPDMAAPQGVALPGSAFRDQTPSAGDKAVCERPFRQRRKRARHGRTVGLDPPGQRRQGEKPTRARRAPPVPAFEPGRYPGFGRAEGGKAESLAER